jgi:hypothetical protein
MPTKKHERTVDVERSALLRLMKEARVRVEEAEQEGANYVSTWWGGYYRALEDLLAMENE